MLATELSGYYGEVKKHLDCPQQEKERLLSEANRLLMDLQADASDLDYGKIVGFFGEPREFADFLMQSVDDTLIVSHEKRQVFRKYLKKLLVICLAVVAIWYVYYTVSFRADPQIMIKETVIIEGISDDIGVNGISDKIGGLK